MTDAGNRGGTDYIRETGEHVALDGDWTTLNAAEIRKNLKKNSSVKDRTAVDLSGIDRIDTSGVWLIRKYFGHETGDWKMTESQRALFDYLPDIPVRKMEKSLHGTLYQAVSSIGHAAENTAIFAYGFICFTGQAFLRLFANALSPRHMRLPSIARHVHETGVRALPIIALLAFLMSMVVSYQAATQLQKFGADIFTVDLTVISMLREMAVLVTAIMVAGRSGSAFAAEIGVMKLRKEVDALSTMGLDPIELLVVPRIIALLITLPLLTFFADIIGLAGGALMSSALLDIPLAQYVDRAGDVATPLMFFTGMIKAPVFAILIALICTYQGMTVTGSAESVGKLTTLAVVQSIFLVIMADALFSVIFSEMDI